MMTPRCRPWAFCLMLGVLAVGVSITSCQGASQRPIPQTYPVRGKVVYKSGGLVTAGRIEFRTPGELYHTILGEVQPDGTFSLYTLSNDKKYPGATEGTHQVFVILVEPHTNEEIRVSAGECTVQPGDNDIILQVEKPRR